MDILYQTRGFPDFGLGSKSETGGLENSGPRLISSIGKTKRIAFFPGKKEHFQKKKLIFLIFQIFIYISFFMIIRFCQDFLDFFRILLRFYFFLFLEIFFILFFFFFRFLGFFSMLLWLLLNVAEDTTEHQKWPKISTTNMKCPIFAIFQQHSKKLDRVD